MNDGAPANGGPRSAASDLVPSRKQYLDLKRRHRNAILLYQARRFLRDVRRGPHVVARDARITLTSRSFGRSGRVPMAGVPHHALNHYLAKLLAAGHTIAIAEQLSEPGKGLVERAGDPGVDPWHHRRHRASTSRRKSLPRRALSSWPRCMSWPGSMSAPASSRRWNSAGANSSNNFGQSWRVSVPLSALIPAGSQPDFTPACHLTPLEDWHFESTPRKRHFANSSAHNHSRLTDVPISRLRPEPLGRFCLMSRGQIPVCFHCSSACGPMRSKTASDSTQPPGGTSS